MQSTSRPVDYSAKVIVCPSLKVIFLASLFLLASAEDSSSSSPSTTTEVPNDGNNSSVDISHGYHLRVGVEEAERLRVQEAMGTRIVGGLPSYTGEHPYMAGLLVSLTTGQTSLCGGTLVSSTRVLTAATCWFDGYSQGHSVLVVLGTVSLYSGGTRVYAYSIYVHPNFNPYSATNDIAMLAIPYVASTSAIKPIVLPYGSYLSNTFAGLRGEIVGYGRTYNGSPITSGQSLRDLYLDVMTNSACQAYYGSAVTSGIVCTSGSGGKGPCGGDMGGPLVYRYYSGSNHMIIGVNSFISASGCQAGHPSGFTRVTAYDTWIRSVL